MVDSAQLIQQAENLVNLRNTILKLQDDIDYLEETEDQLDLANAKKQLALSKDKETRIFNAIMKRVPNQDEATQNSIAELLS